MIFAMSVSLLHANVRRSRDEWNKYTAVMVNYSWYCYDASVVADCASACRTKKVEGEDMTHLCLKEDAGYSKKNKHRCPFCELVIIRARVTELEAELSNVWSRCKIVYFPHYDNYPIEHDNRTNQIMRTEIEKCLRIDSKREGE